MVSPVEERCPFCAIVSGRRQADVLYQLGDFSVFRPLNRQAGKVLIVPHRHYEDVHAMPVALRSEIMNVCSTVSVLLRATSYKIQISCGASAQNVRHLYAQFSYTSSDGDT